MNPQTGFACVACLIVLLGTILLAASAQSLIAATPSPSPIVLPDSAKRYLQEGGLGESGVLEDDPEGDLQTFVDYVLSNWSQMLDSISTVASNTHALYVFRQAAEELHPADYLAFLQKYVQQVSAGNIDANTLRTFLLPTKFKVGFFEYNYNNSAVATILTKIQQSLDPGDPLQSDVKDIQSGKARADFLEYNDAYGGNLLQLVALPK